ncbi:hypothetical protein B0H13DRAFT_1850570 [Mycena leptocephala]|nr:hypothetical protein B0H13DRAFT_1850570 [Mycena leptocephala]
MNHEDLATEDGRWAVFIPVGEMREMGEMGEMGEIKEKWQTMAKKHDAVERHLQMEAMPFDPNNAYGRVPFPDQFANWKPNRVRAQDPSEIRNCAIDPHPSHFYTQYGCLSPKGIREAVSFAQIERDQLLHRRDDLVKGRSKIKGVSSEPNVGRVGKQM